MSTDRADPQAVKDEEAAHPIALAWRPVVRQIVQAFVAGDYALARGVAGVDPIPPERAEKISRYVADYGATLIELPEATWETSCAQWYGTEWRALVDLWTEEEGRSDLVLHLDVRESADGYRFRVDLVYVP